MTTSDETSKHGSSTNEESKCKNFRLIFILDAEAIKMKIEENRIRNFSYFINFAGGSGKTVINTKEVNQLRSILKCTYRQSSNFS